MNQDEILNLSDLAGYDRLYQTLLKDGGISARRLKELMYQWYRANIEAYNTRYGETIKPVDEPDFGWRMNGSKAQLYKTAVQLSKALNLLIWNVADKEPFIQSNQALYDIHRNYADAFRMRHGYSTRDSVTSYSLCEDTLNPVHEPDSEFNPAAMLCLEDSKPRLIYICAPLRGDVQLNIEFARQKAKEVFDSGDIPICPHLMFPPIADPANPEQDKQAIEMCLKLIERCHRVHVYGSEWTEGMWREIHYAERLKIPIHTDQKEIGKTRPRQNYSPCR